jgi:PAS domain S-box-containing protein
MIPDENEKAGQHEILIVDDNPENSILLTHILTYHGYCVRSASGGLLALQSVADKVPDLILLDVMMPDIGGLEVCRRLKSDELSRDIPVLFISALTESTEKIKGFEAGGLDYIIKPFQPEEVLARVKIHLRLRDLTVRLEQKVSERTEKLAAANLMLQQDIAARKQAEEALQRSEFFFKESQRAAAIGSYSTDFIAGYWESSAVLDTIFGIDKNYNRSVQGWLDIIHPEDHDMMDQYLREEIIAKRKPFAKEYRIIRKKSGETRWVHGLGEVKFDNNGNIVSMIGTIQDITERKQMEDKLSYILKAVESASDAIGISDSQGHHVYQNKALSDLFGYATAEELEAAGGGPVVVKDPKVAKEMFDNIMHGKSWTGELEMVTKTGRVFPALERADAIKDSHGNLIGYIGIITDIAERKLTEQLIKQSLKEKESLLSEIHHRVKNNLAVVSSLLALQANTIKDAAMKLLFEESQQRIQSMALVHEMLYKKTDFSFINFRGYITSIIEEITSLYRINTNAITMDLQLDDIELDLDSAVPCGLIINELLTNALKYAFPDSRSGILSISFTKDDCTYILTIKDNGIGMPKGFDYKAATTLGLQLVNGLAGQLGGTLHIISEQGTEAVVAFKTRKSHPGKIMGKRIVEDEAAEVNNYYRRKTP